MGPFSLMLTAPLQFPVDDLHSMTCWPVHAVFVADMSMSARPWIPPVLSWQKRSLVISVVMFAVPAVPLTIAVLLVVLAWTSHGLICGWPTGGGAPWLSATAFPF